MSLLSLSKKILGSKQSEKPAKKKAGKSDASKAVKKAADKAVSEKKKETVTYSTKAGEMALSLIISEKSMAAQAGQTLVARVNPNVGKQEISAAIEEMFGVKVKSVRTLTSHPKTRRRGTSEGKTRRWKKAYITVDDISKINVAP